MPRKRHRPRGSAGLLPTLLTLLNGLCGLGAITIATGAMLDLPTTEAVFFGALLIFLGMLFDMLDGQAARWLNQSSPFGAQLDSLCDAITFGAAPVFIVVTFCDVFHPRFVFGIGALYISCVLLRLARFNVETARSDSHEFFSGLPSPAAAGTVASFAIAMPGLHRLVDPSMPEMAQRLGTWGIGATMVFLPLLTLLLAWLMVSRVRYPHVINQWIRRRYRFYDLARLVLIIIAASTVHELALPLVFCLFALEPPLSGLWSKREGRGSSSSEDSVAPGLPPPGQGVLFGNRE